MAHYDQETLALLAMGERGVTDDQGAHLDSCAACRQDVDQLASVVATARQVSVQDQPQAVPGVVWERILNDVAPVAPVATVAPDQQALAQVVPVRRRSHPALIAAAAALVGIIIGAGATYAATRTPPPAQSASTQIVLQPLDAPAAYGTAALDESAAGQRTLTVQVSGLPTVPGTFYEVWLMNATPQRLLSLGVLGSDHAGTFQIPAGLDLSRYPVVDISLQPFNGSPAHSGNSAVRGTIPA